MQTVIWLAGGALLGAVFLGAAFLQAQATRHILVVGLVIAAVVYVGFSMGARERLAWSLIELAGVGVYGAIGLLGLRRSPWWLAAGWALHPVWDVALHYAGPGRAFAPAWYAVACISFDLVVAGAIAYQIRRGTHPAFKPIPRGGPAPTGTR